MENIQLTDSLVQCFGEESVTLFVGQRSGRYGVVAAPGWEIVLPFCFRRIAVEADGTLTAFLGRRRQRYRVVREGERLEAIALDEPARREKKILSLPA